MKEATINLNDLADQCFKTWETIKVHQMKLELSGKSHGSEIQTEILRQEIEKLRDILNPEFK